VRGAGAEARAEVEAPPETAAALAGLVGIRLRLLQNVTVAHWGQWFRERGVTVTPVQGGILLLIEDNPGIGQKGLASLLSVEAPTLAQALAPLIDGRLVERYRSPRDGRAAALHLTREGARIAGIIRGAMHAHEADALHALSQTERRLLIRLLDKALAGAGVTLGPLPADGPEEPGDGIP